MSPKIERILLIAACLGLAIVPLFTSGQPITSILPELWAGSFGQPRGLRMTLRELVPLLVVGLAVFLALKAGLFNIGAEGQMIVGACAGAAVALAMPTPIGIVLACCAALAAGALWALPAGLIKAYRHGHEVISCIMLNNIALLLTDWLVKGPMKDPSQMDATTPRLPDSVLIPNLAQFGRVEVNLSLLLGIGLVLYFSYWLTRRIAGFELRATGDGPQAARFAGINVPFVTVKAMSLSGALAGLGGALMVLGAQDRFYADFAGGKGFDSLGIALIAGNSALGIFPAAILFAALSAATSSLAQIGVPKGLGAIVLGVLILVVAASRKKESAHE